MSASLVEGRGAIVSIDFIEPVPIAQIRCTGLAWAQPVGDDHIEWVFYTEQGTWDGAAPKLEKVICARILVSLGGAIAGHQAAADIIAQMLKPKGSAVPSTPDGRLDG